MSGQEQKISNSETGGETSANNVQSQEKNDKEAGSSTSDNNDVESSQSSVSTSVSRFRSFDSYNSQNFLDDARCSESMPSTDSNKENIDSNILSQNYSDCFASGSPEDSSAITGLYDFTDLIPLPQLLKTHMNQLVSGFEFGEATKRRAQENMKTARDKKKNNEEEGEEVAVGGREEEKDTNKENDPCGSGTVSEAQHKTPHSRKRQRLTESDINTTSTEKEFSKVSRRIPDCLLGHQECIDVWVYMIYKEEASLKLRNPRLFNDFKSVTPRMRAILLDWLMEVAAVYHLRRVTYYLSVDYFDRFLSIRPDIPKSLLQLVGITCLYIAAKVEEIYPPNLNEFTYVCDGACEPEEMISCELLILNSLGWEVVLTTPSDWLNLYMQLHFKRQEVVRAKLNMDFNKDFVFPQYSDYQFTRGSQLIDLLSLDPGFLKFGYSVTAAGAMYFLYDEEVACSVSGLSWQQLKPCVDYMEAFYTIIKESPDPRLYSCLGGPHPEEASNFSSGLLKRMQTSPQNENYSFQTHIASMEYFEKVTLFRLAQYTRSNKRTPTLLPPPSSNQDEKSTEDVENPSSSYSQEGNLVDDLNSLEDLTGDEEGASGSKDDNLMTLDEIFEFFLNHDDSSTSYN